MHLNIIGHLALERTQVSPAACLPIQQSLKGRLEVKEVLQLFVLLGLMEIILRRLFVGTMSLLRVARLVEVHRLKETLPHLLPTLRLNSLLALNLPDRSIVIPRCLLHRLMMTRAILMALFVQASLVHLGREPKITFVGVRCLLRWQCFRQRRLSVVALLLLAARALIMALPVVCKALLLAQTLLLVTMLQIVFGSFTILHIGRHRLLPLRMEVNILLAPATASRFPRGTPRRAMAMIDLSLLTAKGIGLSDNIHLQGVVILQSLQLLARRGLGSTSYFLLEIQKALRALGPGQQTLRAINLLAERLPIRNFALGIGTTPLALVLYPLIPRCVATAWPPKTQSQARLPEETNMAKLGTNVPFLLLVARRMAQWLQGSTPEVVNLLLLAASRLCLSLPVPLQSFVVPKQILKIVLVLGCLMTFLPGLLAPLFLEILGLKLLARPISRTPLQTIALAIRPLAAPSLILQRAGEVLILQIALPKRQLASGLTLCMA